MAALLETWRSNAADQSTACATRASSNDIETQHLQARLERHCGKHVYIARTSLIGSEWAETKTHAYHSNLPKYRHKS